MNRKQKSRFEVALIYLVLAVMFVIIAYPLFWAFAMSMNTTSNLYTASLSPENWSLENFKWLFY